MKFFKQIILKNSKSKNPLFICGDHYNKKCAIPGEIAICTTSGDSVDIPNQLNGTQTNITAYAGGGQANAYQLHRKFSEVTNLATTYDSIKLKNAVIGRQMIVANSSASDVDIFPAIGEKIYGYLTDEAIALPTMGMISFICVINGQWNTALMY